MNKRVVITGMGAVTPIGNNVEEYWNGLLNGVNGIEKITKFDADTLPVKIAAQVKNLSVEDYLPKKFIRETDDFMQYAFIAMEEALAQSKLEIEPRRTGVVMGTAMNGIATIAQTQDELSRGIHSKVSPRFVPKWLGNIGAAQIAIAKNIHGPSMTLNTACSSGGDAITLAVMNLQMGTADVMLAVGGEASICYLNIAGLSSARALSTNPEPEHACCPFDTKRDGFIMGEGGSCLVLETLEHAKKRGATIIAELVGCANNTDGYHVTSPDPEGTGAVACMEDAMAAGGIEKNQIGYINAHGTSTKMGDVIETKAIHKTFGEYATKIPVTSTKSLTGHLMGAGGITEVIACVKAVTENKIPGTYNLTEQDPECDLDYVPNTTREAKVDYAISNAFGFGGQNSSILVGKYVD